MATGITARKIATPLLAGLLATATMDAASVLATRGALLRPGPDPVGPKFLGRWVGYMARGRLRHAHIVETPELPRETLLGFVTHYAVGMALSAVYFMLLRLVKARPNVASALLYGAATSLFSWLIVHPAYGLGVFGRRATNPNRMIWLSLVGHLIFGGGIAWWSAVLRSEMERGEQ